MSNGRRQPDPNRVIAMLREQIGGLTVELALVTAERDQIAEALAKHEPEPEPSAG